MIYNVTKINFEYKINFGNLQKVIKKYSEGFCLENTSSMFTRLVYYQKAKLSLIMNKKHYK